jgi:hypothetical protein
VCDRQVERIRRFLRRWNSAATLPTLFVVALSAVVSILLWIAQISANSINYRSFIAAQRPWVSIDVPQGADFFTKGGALTFADGNVRASIPVSLRNAGHSPALRVRVKIDLFVRGATQTSKQEAQQAVCAKPWSDNLTVSIFPDRSYEMREIIGATRETIEAALRGIPGMPGPMLDAIGCVKYASSVGEQEGETGFAFLINSVDGEGNHIIINPTTGVVPPRSLDIQADLEGSLNYAK